VAIEDKTGINEALLLRYNNTVIMKIIRRLIIRLTSNYRESFYKTLTGEYKKKLKEKPDRRYHLN
jgi:hypothetical protein